MKNSCQGFASRREEGQFLVVVTLQGLIRLLLDRKQNALSPIGLADPSNPIGTHQNVQPQEGGGSLCLEHLSVGEMLIGPGFQNAPRPCHAIRCFHRRTAGRGLKGKERPDSSVRPVEIQLTTRASPLADSTYLCFSPSPHVHPHALASVQFGLMFESSPATSPIVLKVLVVRKLFDVPSVPRRQLSVTFSICGLKSVQNF